MKKNSRHQKIKDSRTHFQLPTSRISNSGQSLIFVLVVLTLVLVSTVLLTGGALTFFQDSNYSVDKVEATSLAETGIDKALASLNASGGSYAGETETAFGTGTYGVTITSQSPTTKIIQATGYIPNKANPKAKKTISITATTGVGASFNYGMQIDRGGINLSSNVNINGGVYSNGSIVGGTNNKFKGDVYVAGGTQPTADQQSDCTIPNCGDYEFGRNSGNNPLDIAQSFQPTSTQVINKIALKLKKIGSPPNVTVRILGNSGSNPNKNSVLATGTLSSNLVTNSYGFVEVALNTNPTLTANTPYWIVVDTSADSSNYWNWSSDPLQGYTRGQAKWSSNWQAGSPVWSSINADLGFKTYMGGVVTQLNLGADSRVTGSVHANTIIGSWGSGSFIITKDAYYQSIVTTTVQGNQYPGSTDPPPTTFPISDANITDWKDQAELAGVTQGNVSYPSNCNINLGPRKITGNLTIGSNCTVTIKSPLWVQGNLSVNSNAKLKLDPSAGVLSGLIIVDGTSTMSSNTDLIGSGVTGSYMMLLSTKSGPAIDLQSNGVSGIVYAQNGFVNLASNATFHEIVAYGLNMASNSTLNYDIGLASIVFSSGPSGSYSLVKGTYQSK